MTTSDDRLARRARRLLPKSIRRAAEGLLRVPDRLDALQARLDEMQRVGPPEEQVVPARGLRRYEFRAHSQNGEDGILLYLFSVTGTANRRFVEIGIGDGTECNTANLSLNFGWKGLLIDRDEKAVDAARTFYATKLGERAKDVRSEAHHVTRGNVNEPLLASGFEGEIDLLSIDIDGNDYWIWEAIEVVSPRIVVIEYNATLGWEYPLVVPYDPHFSRFERHESGFYHGASLAALVKLGNSKGYCFVGCESAGVNAFFVRRDASLGKVQDVPVDQAWAPTYSRIRYGSAADQFERIRDLPFVEV